MGLADRLRKGLEKSREALNQIFYMGGEVDEQFWEDLEDTLVMGDIGPEVAMKVVDDLRELSARQALRTADQMREALAKRLAEAFPAADRDPFDDTPSCVIFVGINGAGKTTTVGKLAGAAQGGRHVGSHRRRRHVPCCGHRAAQGLGRSLRRGGRHARARRGPGKRVL